MIKEILFINIFLIQVTHSWFPVSLQLVTFMTILYLLFLTVNSVCWAPHDYGLILACGSSDGAISLLGYTGDGQWEVKKISNAHTVSLYL